MNEEEKKAIEYLNNYKYDNEVRKAIDIILNLVKKLKENCKKCIIRDELDEYVNNSIPVQKIKDKIEGIQEEGYWLFTTDRDSDKCVEVLQELLEK